MTAYELDPLQDSRWLTFIDNHAQATAFHTPSWLEVLRRTYGYEPLVLTTAAPGEPLRDGLVMCRVKSWITGRRAVSLPFSDHCQPLVESDESFQYLLSVAKRNANEHRIRCLEIRPLSLPGDNSDGLQITGSFCLHHLDLRPTVTELYQGFHKDCIQRKISRANREGLRYEQGRSESLLDQFYRLMVMTRQRHQLVPQPLAWFHNVIDCMSEMATIRVASKNGHPVAAMLTLSYRDTVIYKYGCSDKRFSNLGGMQLLFWRAIEEAKQRGLHGFDLGRSDWDNPGLLRFKDRLGAKRSTLSYWRCGREVINVGTVILKRLSTRLFAQMPTRLLPLAGRLVYRHMS